jgi:hypothetical protein
MEWGLNAGFFDAERCAICKGGRHHKRPIGGRHHSRRAWLDRRRFGRGLIKQRIARQGQGKRGGWRTLIAYRQGQRSVFLLGFAKSDLDNISPDQLASFKTLATGLLAASDATIAAELKRETLKEVPYGKKD